MEIAARNGKITQAELDEGLKEPIVFVRPGDPRPEPRKPVARRVAIRSTNDRLASADRVTRHRHARSAPRAVAAMSERRRPGARDRQQAYMKSAMPYHGVRSAACGPSASDVFAGYDFAAPDATAWRDDVLALWRGAEFREERYAAIELGAAPRARPFQTMEALADVRGDDRHRRLVGLRRRDRGPRSLADPARRAVRCGARCSPGAVDDDMWKRRSAILCQLPFKDETDLELLYACIEPSLSRKEFLLRKAIGWALREYAKTDAREVARYVERNAERLSALSREALKSRGSDDLRKAARASATSSPARGAQRRSA